MQKINIWKNPHHNILDGGGFKKYVRSGERLWDPFKSVRGATSCLFALKGKKHIAFIDIFRTDRPQKTALVLIPNKTKEKPYTTRKINS